MTACNCAETPHLITRTTAGVRYRCSGCGSETVVPKPRARPIIAGPVRTSRPLPLVEGGQGRSGAELWSGVDRLTAILAAPAALIVCVLLGIALAELMAHAATALGQTFLAG